MAEGKYVLGPNSQDMNKWLLDGGIRAMPKVLEAYMGEATLPNDPTQDKTHGLYMRWP